MEEIIVTIIIMLFGAGIPAFLAYKLNVNPILTFLVYVGLTYWVIPDFTIWSILAYLGGFVAIYLIGQNKHIKAMSDEEREQYIEEKNKELSELSRQREQDAIDKKTVRCPNCQSIDVQFLENKRKGFSVGKAVGGGLLTGGIGTLAGFAGKKGKKDLWHCENCGYTFERKR